MDYHSIPANIEQDTPLIDIATRNVIRLGPEDAVGEAARIMAEKHISSIVITDRDGHPSGIITERNMLRAMQSKCPPETVLRKIMSAPVITVPPSITCLDAYQVGLRNGIQHLVIVNEAKLLLGVVSETDFRQHINLSVLAGRRQVASVMSRSVFTQSPEANLRDTLNLMHAHHDSCVVIVEDRRPIGIVTERDIVRLYSVNPEQTDIPVSAVMTSPVLTISRANPINEAAKLMLSNKLRHLIVVDDIGQIAGLLNEHDLTHNMAFRLIDDKLIAEGVFLHTLVNTIPDMIWLKDINGVYQACNARFERFLGEKEKNIIGKTDYDFVDKTQADAFRAHDCLTMAKNSPSINEAWCTYADDGHRELLETIKTPMRDSQGKLIGVLGISRDITARNLAERALLESQSKLREQKEFLASILESSLDAFMLMTSDGVITMWSSQAEKMFGWTRDEAVGRFMHDTIAPHRFHDAHARSMRRFLSDAEKTGFNTRIEVLGLHRDGREFPIELSISLIKTENGCEISSFIRDISERKRMEQQLTERESLFHAIFDQATDGIELIDPEELRFVEANPATCRMLGYSYEEYLQLHLEDTQVDLLGEALITTVRQVEASGGATFENRHRCKNGDILNVEVTSRILDLPGKRLLVGVWRDITERKRAEEVLRENEAKYRLLFETANDGIFLLGTAGFIDCNEKGACLFGLTREELIGRFPADLAPERQPDGRLSAEVADVIVAAALAGEPQQFEWRCLRVDSTCLEVEITLNRIEMGGSIYLQAVVRDITERKRAEANLAAREREFRTLAENSPDNIVRYDCEARILYANPTLTRTLGISSADLLGKTPMEIINGELFEEYQQTILTVGATGKNASYEQIVPIGKGHSQIHFIRLVAELGPDGKPVGVLGVGRDISEIKRAEENLRITASVFDNSQEAILITDANNTIIDVNPAFTLITGYQREEVLGHNPKLLRSKHHDQAFYAGMWKSLQQKKYWRGEIWNQRKSGETYAELLSIASICDDDGKAQRYVGVFSDISYLKEHEAELSRVAHYDALTGIPNRVLLADRMKQAIAKTAREKNLVAICYLDLDGFKAINDNLGHDAGDQVLIEVSRRIKNTIRGGDTVARLGGDEFVVLLELEKGEECGVTLERLLSVIAEPIIVKDKPQMLSASIGVSLYPLDDENSDTLLRHADQAMYVAKQSGKNRFHIYDTEMDLRARSHNELLKNIRYGLDNNQFELYFQPKINLSTKQLVGAEALIRWHHPERGLLPPIEFLRLIENTELDIEIGNWVIAAALNQLSRWHCLGLDIEISINISAYHLESPRFTEKLRQQLARHKNIQPGKLQIEILETAALNDLSIVCDIIQECRQIGVGFALDDFGTGYSSLSYLSKLPVDVLKIDQSFVRDMLEDKGDKAIVQGIIALAQAFGRQTVAEGIETEEHYRTLHDMGCQVGQGYSIARPMPANELANWQPQ
ncbi:PAS domain S-box protein [Candidatus Methylobacter oryzae]|uniref:PAS domain S-box protein n=1 Tax=Candidatus Methylobacter oryzae TaxID=2497749 RepID=A0ABY3C9X7_9GAMM|nr:PAS domain S-box protein [Candidatus Methylobacter oryzae]TRW92912.1 PAS domain S-box protein [Candidatus Methylobacter oryzae]